MGYQMPSYHIENTNLLVRSGGADSTLWRKLNVLRKKPKKTDGASDIMNRMIDIFSDVIVNLSRKIGTFFYHLQNCPRTLPHSNIWGFVYLRRTWNGSEQNYSTC